MTFDRREFLKTAAAGTLASNSFASLAAAESGVVRWLTAENTTGNWDPSANTNLANIYCEYLTHDYLLTYPMTIGTDVTVPVRSLAQSFKVIGPFKVEMELRPGVRFHDGAELVAEDVKATFEHYSRPKVGRPLYPGKIASSVTGKYRLTIDCEAAGMPMHKFLFLQFISPILRAKDVADPKALQSGMNGTGPFRFAGVERGSLIFEANRHYWGPNKPQLKRIILRHVPDGNARVLALLSGEAEITERLEPEQYQSLKSKPGIVVSKTKSTENKFLHFRNGKKPFDDWRVRRAAAAAIDRDAILGIVGDAGYAADCLVPPMKLGYEPSSYGRFDPAECQRLLAEAGYPKGRGLPELDYITSTGFYPKTKEYGEAITAMLQAQGFPVKLTVMETAAWSERLYNPQQGHMIDSGWSPGTPEPDVQLVFLYFSKVGLITGCNDPAIDAALLKEMGTADLAARRKLLQKETIPTIVEKMPNLVLFNSNLLHAQDARLKGVTFLSAGMIDFTKATLA